MLYGFGYSHGTLELQMFLGSAVIVVIGIVCARYLRHPDKRNEPR